MVFEVKLLELHCSLSQHLPVASIGIHAVLNYTTVLTTFADNNDRKELMKNNRWRCWGGGGGGGLLNR